MTCLKVMIGIMMAAREIESTVKPPWIKRLILVLNFILYAVLKDLVFIESLSYLTF